MGGLLLQRTGGEGGRRCSLERLFDDGRNGEIGVFAFFQEFQSLFMAVESAAQFGFNLGSRAVGIYQGKGAVHPVEGLTLECLYLPLPFHDEPYGHTLHASGREGWLDLLPEQR